jgi:hypothetical protein
VGIDRTGCGADALEGSVAIADNSWAVLLGVYVALAVGPDCLSNYRLFRKTEKLYEHIQILENLTANTRKFDRALQRNIKKSTYHLCVEHRLRGAGSLYFIWPLLDRRGDIVVVRSSSSHGKWLQSD